MRRTKQYHTRYLYSQWVENSTHTHTHGYETLPTPTPTPDKYPYQLGTQRVDQIVHKLVIILHSSIAYLTKKNNYINSITCSWSIWKLWKFINDNHIPITDNSKRLDESHIILTILLATYHMFKKSITWLFSYIGPHIHWHLSRLIQHVTQTHSGKSSAGTQTQLSAISWKSFFAKVGKYSRKMKTYYVQVYT
jgi:hypothetical protein